MSAYSQPQLPDAVHREGVGVGARVGGSSIGAYDSGTSRQNGTALDTKENLALVSPVTALEFQVIDNRVALEALEDEWNSLFARAGKPHQVFQTFNWCWQWCRHFLGGDYNSTQATSELSRPHDSSSLFVVVARRQGTLVMVWPMVRYLTLGISKLSWLGAPVSQYGDVVVDDVCDKDQVLRDGWDYLLAHAGVDIVQLWKVRHDSNVAGLLASINGVVTDSKIAPYLTLGQDGSAEDYLKRKPRARNRRRIRRSLETSGGVGFEVLSPGNQARDVSKVALEWKRAWLKDKGLFSRALNDPRTDAFFLDVTTGAQRCVDARVSSLSVGDQLVAVEIGFPCKGALAMHVIVYDHTFKKSGCGALAMEDSIRACWADGFSTFDLLAPGDSYKLDWADGSIGVDDWSVAVNMKGRAWGWVETNVVKNGVKRALDLFPVSIRQFVSRMLGAVAGSRGK